MKDQTSLMTDTETWKSDMMMMMQWHFFSLFQTTTTKAKNGDDSNGTESENFNEMLSDITKDIDFQKVDLENEESGVEEMSNGESSKEEAKEEKQDSNNSDSGETKKEK